MSTTATALTSSDEFQLVKQAQKGDEKAFEALYRHHSSRVFNICLSMTKNFQLAEDLTQDVFLRVFRKLKMFGGNSALHTWIYRVTVNIVLMHFRKHKNSRAISLNELLDTEGEEYIPRERFGTRDGRLDSTVVRCALVRAIADLPPKQQVVYTLHELRGCEHHEVARIMKCSEGNSKSQLHKAKAKLRDALAPRVSSH